MVTATDTRVIDAEFAAYGPIGFDLGLFVGNLLMAFFSQPGHAGDRAEYGEWILAQVAEFWRVFVSEYDALWAARRPTGDGYPSVFFTDERPFTLERERYFSELLADTLGFAGTEIIRRIVGFAHNKDFESIDNPDLRARLERRALSCARTLIVEAQGFSTMDSVLTHARQLAS
jgi:5-methylthioribose kinase